ncbi:MAG: chemotaxis protein CheD [Planctomycetes bacterium]|nr:chemotaxis protein CheD [Planctomycetota bacterium]
MASITALRTTQDATVGMGGIAVARDPARLSSVLGSCVGVALYHARHRVGALAHVVLPESSGFTAAPGKFADTAIADMLRQLRQLGAGTTGLVAKIAGGASMFATSGPLQIGSNNVQKVTELLQAEGIRIAGRCVGGVKGRRVTLDCSNGNFLVEIAGAASRML